MKYLLIAMMVVSGTIQAKAFSMADYASQTGKIPAKVVKSDNSFTDKVKSTETAIIKREAKGASLQVRVGEVGKQYSEQMVRLSRMEGDTTPSREAAAMDRKTRLFSIHQEISRNNKRLSELREMLKHYKNGVEFKKEGDKLRGRGLISSSC